MLLEAGSLAVLESDSETSMVCADSLWPCRECQYPFIHTLGNHTACQDALEVCGDVLGILDG